MKKLEDLKKELLNNDLQNLYIFYGKDYGIRKHYIQKIGTYFNNKIQYADSYLGVKVFGKTKSLFGTTKELVVIYNDVDFAELKKSAISKFLEGLKDVVCIFVYEELPNKSDFLQILDSYITNFPIVQKNIAKEFVDSEIILNKNSAEELAYNCENNYNTILLESDKIREYAHYNKISNQSAYESLCLKNQLPEKIDAFECDEFMYDVLTEKQNNYKYWYVVANNDVDKFFMYLQSMFNDYIIAGLVKQYGKYEGGNIAYNLRYSWRRSKVIRELCFDMKHTYDYYYDRAYDIAYLDEAVKTGRVEKNKIVEYFFSKILKN